MGTTIKPVKPAEKILKIKETTFINDDTEFDGFEIVTNRQIIRVGISNTQQAREDWGYLMSNDDIDEFINAELQSIEIADRALKTKKVEEVLDDFYYGGLMFINFNTNKGVLQFVAYNDHNGYYGHDAVLISKQLKYEEEL